MRDAAAALDFYKRAFGATELMRIPGPGGTVGHAEIKIGDSPIMLADEYAEMKFLSPQSRGGTTVHIHLYVEDVDAAMAQAVSVAATLKRPAQDQFYGDRTGTVEDPFGHVWHIATHKEDLSPEELVRRATSATEALRCTAPPCSPQVEPPTPNPGPVGSVPPQETRRCDGNNPSIGVGKVAPEFEEDHEFLLGSHSPEEDQWRIGQRREVRLVQKRTSRVPKHGPPGYTSCDGGMIRQSFW